MRAHTHTRARDGTRFPANCFVSSLFSPLSSLLSSFSFSFSLSFFFGRALSSCIGSVLLIVTALGRRGREREGGGKGSFGSISRMKTRRRVPT